MRFKKIKLEGDLIFSAPMAKQEIREAEGSSNIELDFTDVEYVDSTGISMILQLHKKMKPEKGKLRLVGVRETVFSSLQASSVDEIAEIRTIPVTDYE